MADYIRARTPERKQERMQAIMAAADGLFAERPYHQITMGTIAGRLGWSRSNLYKYAATQEEVFLALHSAKNRAWLEELASELDGAPLPAAEFARTWSEATARHPSFLRYQGILVSVIESNVTHERLVAFKRDFAEMVGPVIGVLMRQCGVGEAEALGLYLRLLYQAPPLWDHHHFSEATMAAMREAGIPETRGTFEDAYADFVEMCVRCASEKHAASSA